MQAKTAKDDEICKLGQAAYSQLLQQPATAAITIALVYPSRRRYTSHLHHHDSLFDFRSPTSCASRPMRSADTNDFFSRNALELFSLTTLDHSLYNLIILLEDAYYSGHPTKNLLGANPSIFAKLFSL